jgi:hypothetical protein
MKYIKAFRKRSYWIDLINLVDSVIVCSKLAMPLPPQPTRATGSARGVIKSPKTWTI